MNIIHCHKHMRSQASSAEISHYFVLNCGGVDTNTGTRRSITESSLGTYLSVGIHITRQSHITCATVEAECRVNIYVRSYADGLTRTHRTLPVSPQTSVGIFRLITLQTTHCEMPK